jgi:hypothetical protein
MSDLVTQEQKTEGFDQCWPPGACLRLMVNFDRSEYFRISPLWPVYLGVLRGYAPSVDPALNPLVGSWGSDKVEVVLPGDHSVPEAAEVLMAMEALKGHESPTAYRLVRRDVADLTWELGSLVTLVPALREQCYRLLAVPATYSWLTKPEADCLLRGVAAIHGTAFAREYVRWLADRPGLTDDVKSYLSC